MKFKNKLFAFILIFVLIITVANCSFAEDLATNETAEISNIASMDESKEIYISSTGNDNNNGSIDSPKASLGGSNGALKTASEKNITTIVIIGEINEHNININFSSYKLNNLSIKGMNSASINANGQGNIFNILGTTYKNGFSLYLNNITLKNSNGFNAAIDNENASLFINNCIFYDNYGSSGSVLSNYYEAETTITNSTIYNNKGEHGIIYNNNGNSIDSYNNTITVINSSFYNNSATSGGVFNNIASGNSISIINIKGSRFENNSASQIGGVIYSISTTIDEYNKGSVITNITNSSFVGNSAPSGGVIYTVGNSDLFVDNSCFINNSASGQYDVAVPSQGSGGAIYSYSGSVLINNSCFENNSASNGGAIFNDYANDLQIINSKFIANRGKHGGALYMNTPQVYGHESYVLNSTFENNKAEYFGDAIYSYDLDDVAFLVKSSSFANNTLYNKGNINLTSSNFTNSNIINNSGKICNKTNKFKNSTLINLEPISIEVFSIEGYYGDRIVIKAKVSNDKYISSGIVLTIGPYNIPAYYNNTTKYYEGSYFINNYLSPTANSSKYSIIADCPDYPVKNITIGYLTVIKQNTTLNISVEDIYEGQAAIITITLKTAQENVNGFVVVTVNGDRYYVTIKDGVGKLELNDLKTGKYTVAAEYSGNSRYSPSTSTNSFYVKNFNKNDTSISISIADVNLNEQIVAVVRLNPAINGDITITINNKDYAFTVANGYGSFTISENLGYGTYTATVSFDGTDKYNPSSNSTIFKVNRLDAKLTADNDSFYYSGDFIITLVDQNNMPIANQQLIVEINNVNQTVTTDSNGRAIVKVNEAGKFNINVYYSGNYLYNPQKTSAYVEVYTTIISDNLVKYYRNGTQFVVQLLDSNGSPLANANVNLIINGVLSSRTTNENGIITVSINLNPGHYNIIIENPKTNQKVTNNIDVLPTVDGKDLTKFYKNDSQYYAKFLNPDGTPLANAEITFNINGVFYKRTTDSQGIARMNINLGAGEYIITATNPANQELYSNLITVLSTISGNDVIKYYRNGTQYYARFFNADGTPLANTDVTFNINGVFYKRTTDSQGIAKLSINLNPARYIITAINPVNDELFSNIITVLPTITENKDINMNYGDGTRFSVKILDDNGMPKANAEVVFNINGVFYTKITDANGIASLTINLLAGKYIITSMYNSLSVANTITIH